jgi:hypothetical protein
MKPKILSTTFKNEQTEKEVIEVLNGEWDPYIPKRDVVERKVDEVRGFGIQ